MRSFEYLNIFLPFFGALLGMFLALVTSPKKPDLMKLTLAFSGSFLLAIIFFHLIPEVYSTPKFNVGIWIMGGLILQLCLEQLSKGTEHGHSHDSSKSNFQLVIWISLFVHSFIEGIPLSNESQLAWGIFIHKIPIGMILIYTIWNNKTDKILKVFGLLTFSIMTPLGSFLGKYYLINENFRFQITAIVIGMLLHISTTILFENNQGHKVNFRKFFSIFTGIFLAYCL
jgi:zinc transporter ZupT